MAIQSWNVDATHSEIHFAVRHLVIAKVRGRFNRWTADLRLDEADLTRSSVTVEIDADSIDTKNDQRDAHLRSVDFLDAEHFAKLLFRSKRVEPAGDNRYRVIGDLTIHGVTKEVVLETEFAGIGNDPWGGRRAGFSAHVAIDRRDFGLTWNLLIEAGGVAVGEKVEIDLDIEAIAPAASKAA